MKCFHCNRNLHGNCRVAKIYFPNNSVLMGHWSCASRHTPLGCSGIRRVHGDDTSTWDTLTNGQKGVAKRLAPRRNMDRESEEDTINATV
jgi:hypothetical protein